jgi:hypothetical protein
MELSLKEHLKATNLPFLAKALKKESITFIFKLKALKIDIKMDAFLSESLKPKIALIKHPLILMDAINVYFVRDGLIKWFWKDLAYLLET